MQACGVAMQGCGVAIQACGVAMQVCGVAMQACAAIQTCGVGMQGCGVAMQACGETNRLKYIPCPSSALTPSCLTGATRTERPRLKLGNGILEEGQCQIVIRQMRGTAHQGQPRWSATRPTYENGRAMLSRDFDLFLENVCAEGGWWTKCRGNMGISLGM